MTRSKRRWLARMVAGLALVGAGSCAPLGLLDAITPRGAYRPLSGIAFGPNPRHRLDVYVPDSPAGPRQVIVFFYGGNWRQGDRGAYRFVAESLTRAGYVVVIPDYRLYPAVTFPAFIEDSARAIAWVAGNIGRYGGDPDAIYLMGHSAGAYNAVMVALDRRYLRAAGSEVRIAGVIGIAGPYDFLPLTDPTLQAIFTPQAAHRQTQPIDLVDAQAPPMLLVTGTDDTVVLPGNTRRLAARLREQGVLAREILYPRLGHVEIVLGLSSPLRGNSTLLDDIRAFTQRELARSRAQRHDEP